MRKVTEQAVEAFVNNAPFKLGNTRVEVRGGETFMYLHDNMIAHKTSVELYITHCGWRSNTTKERLNGILDEMGLPKLYQKKGIWYIGPFKQSGLEIDEVFEGNKLFTR